MTAFWDEMSTALFTWTMLGGLAATVIAGLMRGYAGFGTAVILAPIYSTLWGAPAGIPVMLLMELLISAQLLPAAMREADKRVILPIGGTALLTLPLGTLILYAADPDLLRRVIGGFVLVFGFLLMSGWRYDGSRPLWLNMSVGGVAGVLKGATGMSGPPVILYLLAGPEDARRHRANLILFFGIIAVASVVGPFLLGLITMAVLAKLAVLLPVMLLSVPIGVRLFHVVPQRLYKPFAMAVLVVVGGIALFG